MPAQKILHADVQSLNKRLTQHKTTKEQVFKKISQHPFAYVASERKIVPYDQKALTKQFTIYKELIADYVDIKQIAMFDEAIRLLDEADIAGRK